MVPEPSNSGLNGRPGEELTLPDRERHAKNDERLRESTLVLASLKAELWLEDARAEAEKLDRREEAAAAAAATGRCSGNGSGGSVCGKRPRCVCWGR